MSSQAVTPRRLTFLIVPVCVAGLGILVAAMYEFATAAQRFPVPIDVESGGGGVVSLTFVFAVAAIVLYGWAAGALLLLVATGSIHAAQHRPLQRIAFNVAVLAIVALVAGMLIAPI